MNIYPEINVADQNWLPEDFDANDGDVKFCPHCDAVVDEHGISIETHSCQWCREAA